MLLLQEARWLLQLEGRLQAQNPDDQGLCPVGFMVPLSQLAALYCVSPPFPLRAGLAALRVPEHGPRLGTGLPEGQG